MTNHRMERSAPVSLRGPRFAYNDVLLTVTRILRASYRSDQEGSLERSDRDADSLSLEVSPPFP